VEKKLYDEIIKEAVAQCKLRKAPKKRARKGEKGASETDKLADRMPIKLPPKKVKMNSMFLPPFVTTGGGCCCCHASFVLSISLNIMRRK
jgi:hypothetical protein